jgi:hypothetical protein
MKVRSRSINGSTYMGDPEKISIFFTVAASKRSRAPKSMGLWLWLSPSLACKTRIKRLQTIEGEAFGLEELFSKVLPEPRGAV